MPSFMVAAALLGAAGLAAGMTVLQLILVAAVMNAAVAVFIYSLVPEFLLRFIAWLLVHTLYRSAQSTAPRIFPKAGPHCWCVITSVSSMLCWCRQPVVGRSASSWTRQFFALR